MAWSLRIHFGHDCFSDSSVMAYPVRDSRVKDLGRGPNLDQRSVMARRAFSSVDYRVPAGLLIAALGVLLTLLSFTARVTWSVQRFWPLLVVGFGVMRIAEESRRIDGWILLLVGGGVQLSNLGLFALPGRTLVRYWPLVVVLVGLWELASSWSMGAKVEASAVVLLGVWLQLSYFGAPQISSYRTWPLVLAAIGGVMAWRGFYGRTLF
jgi:LiaF transmembrane domain